MMQILFCNKSKYVGFRLMQHAASQASVGCFLAAQFNYCRADRKTLKVDVLGNGR